MFELEQSTRFAVSGNLLSQLLFIGIGDLGMLTVLALLIGRHGLTMSVTLLSLVVPFLTATVCCLMLWTRIDPALFQTAGIALSAVFSVVLRSDRQEPPAGSAGKVLSLYSILSDLPHDSVSGMPQTVSAQTD